MTVLGSGDAGYVEISGIATGGTITYDGDYIIHTFTESGTFTINFATNVEVMVVAGGGGGGSDNYESGRGAGGGGAGGYIYNASSSASGNGGEGTANSITGSLVTYAGGGGGVGQGTQGTGTGGGGNAGSSGTANTGGGGGAGDAAKALAACTGGSGIVIVRYRCYYPSGELQSRVHDTTEAGTSWGEISWGESVPAGTDIKLKTRTGDVVTPDGSWSSWYPVGDEWYEVNTGTPIGSPRARYIQYLSSFTTTISTRTPQLTEVNIQCSTNTASAPSLTSPDSSWNNSTPVFDWTFGDNEDDTQTAFRIQIATFSELAMTPPYGFAGTPKYDSGELSQSWSSYTWTSEIDDGIYWWQCKTQDSYGKWSVWSDTYQVKVDTIAPVGMTISWIRADNENQITLEGMGTDAGSGLNENAWWFEETTGNPGATSSTVWESTSVYTDSGLSKNTQYTYRVKLRDNLGNESDWTTAVNKKTQPCVWQEKTTTKPGPNAFGFDGDGVWTWEVPVNGGTAVTVTVYAQYNSDYGEAGKPKVTLSNKGVNSSMQMTGGADTWEKLSVSGTPSGKGVLFLKVEGFSTAVGAKYFVDDIQVNP